MKASRRSLGISALVLILLGASGLTAYEYLSKLSGSPVAAGANARGEPVAVESARTLDPLPTETRVPEPAVGVATTSGRGPEMASSQPEPAGVEACVHSLHERASRGDRDAQYAWAQILADCRFLSDENLGGKEAERLEVEPQATCSSSDGVAEALSPEHVRALCGQHGTPDGGYVHWLRKSASAGHPEAIRALFHHHPLADREGRVDPWQAVRYAEEVHQLEQEARMWMLGLAHSGHAGALSDLAIAYGAGERLDADLPRSLAYARSACSLRPVDCGVAPGQPGLAQLIAQLEADLGTDQLEQADRIEQAIRGRFRTGSRR